MINEIQQHIEEATLAIAKEKAKLIDEMEPGKKYELKLVSGKHGPI